MNFKKFHESRNLFDYQTMPHGTDGKYLDENGNLQSSSAWAVTDFIPCNGSAFTLHKVGGGLPAICLYDAEKQYIIGKKYNTGGAANKADITITSQINASYIRFSWYRANDASRDDLTAIMLNSGSQPLPYEPYGNTWHDTPHYIHKTSTDTLTTLPTVLYPTGSTATVGLKGQAVQSTTPTPQNHVMPNGTGERTGNLAPTSTYTNSQTDSQTAFRPVIQLRKNNANVFTKSYSNISSSGTYSFAFTVSDDIDEIRLIHNGSQRNLYPVDVIGTFAFGDYVLTTTFSSANPSVIDGLALSNIMLNTGNTPLPYEPWGIKIPISSANTATPVYLGEVQSTRRIKKLVLTGDEAVENAGGNAPYRISVSGLKIPTTSQVLWMCSHYQAVPSSASWSQYNSLISWNGGEGTKLRFRDTSKADVNAFKAFLLSEYANGTPVTVWYVLSEPTTGMVNEPLMKIGTYSDEVSNISIPVTAGGDTLSVGTTIQPSEVTVNYKGWHSVQNVHEYTNGTWT